MGFMSEITTPVSACRLLMAIALTTGLAIPRAWADVATVVAPTTPTVVAPTALTPAAPTTLATPVAPTTLTVPASPLPTSPVMWQRILVCDQGHMWVDVDLNERRHLQVVSRDPAANQYLASLQINPTSTTSDLSQMTFELTQDTGVFKQEDFTVGASQQSFTFTRPLKIGDDQMTQYTVNTHVFRDASGGLKIEYVRSNMLICAFYDADSQSCSGGRTYSVRDRYVGNWYFSGCQ